MTALRSIALAFTLFSRVPMPHVEWNPENMRYTMLAFPLVGCVIGTVVAIWCALCATLGLNGAAFGAGTVLVPLFVTGGIHMDGFADVVDAQSSHAAPERKREILADPHIGAFATVGIGGYLLAWAALASNLSPNAATAAALALVFVLSRATSGIATVAYPASKTSGMLAAERSASARTAVLAGIALVATGCLTGLVVLAGAPGACAGIAALICLATLKRFARTRFGGMSGDLAGFHLQVSELAMVTALVIAQAGCAL